MDFNYIEDANIRDLKRTVSEANNFNGGLWGIIASIKICLSAIFEIIISAGIITTLFTSNISADISDKYLFIQSPMMSVILLVVMITATILYSLIQGRLGKIQGKLMSAIMPLNRIFFYINHKLIFNYENGKDIRLYNAQDMIINTNTHFMNKAKKMVTDLIVVDSAKLSAIGSVINSILMGFIYLFVIVKAFVGVITIGNVLMQIGAIQRFYSSISALIVEIKQLKVKNMYFDKGFEFLELPPIKYQGTLPVEKRADNKYTIELKDVSFKYPGTEEFVLKNVSLKLSIGERLAVVGMNGAGKTTMIKLLCRLYDPTEGEILLNGIDIKKYDYKEYMSLFSVVFQDFKLFSFPIDQNVAASMDIDNDKLNESLEEAGIKKRIDDMKNGAGTYIGKSFDKNGIDISGGEQQKIAIARALYKDAPIVILDEPTAALDPISEFEIYSKFDNLVGNKTAIYISHRLSSCRFCHDIAVFHEGEIIERGSHDELIKNRNGKYFELWNAQAQYYKK